MTGSNVINVLKGRGGGLWGGLCPFPPPPGVKAFLLVTDNRRSRLDSPFCIITQQRKFEFGHHRQNKKIRNAQELTMHYHRLYLLLQHKSKSQAAKLQIIQKRSCPSALILFSISVYKFLVDCFTGGGLSGSFFCLWLLLLLKKDFEG